jgi:uncharacterized protein YndB with AHSA1/START domain
MGSKGKTNIIVKTVINAPAEVVWKCWTTPEDIVRWNNASDDWHTTRAENDLRKGGKFLSRMEARDGSTGFDFEGVYQTVKTNELIEYVIGDGRKVIISFTANVNGIKVEESFETEDINSAEQQRSGWQAILDNFKKYTESRIKSNLL